MIDSKMFNYKISDDDEFALLTVDIPENEKIKVEASSMATMDSHISMKTRSKGGIKRFFSKESFFINEFTADGAGGEISIAPALPGQIIHHKLNNDGPLFLQPAGYLASTMGVTTDLKWQGLKKGFFSGESFFLIKCEGQGDLWFNSFGAIFEVDVVGEYVVDTSHIVAFTDGLEYNIGRIGGYKSLLFSGEGFICRFSGQGKLWIQTKKPNAFIHWADAHRKVSRRG